MLAKPSKDQTTGLAAKRDAESLAMETARTTKLRWLIGIYCVGGISGMTCMMIGAIASSWYKSSEVTEQSPIGADQAFRYSEDFAMAVTGISVLAQYCRGESDCFTHRDLFVWFDSASNVVPDRHPAHV